MPLSPNAAVLFALTLAAAPPAVAAQGRAFEGGSVERRLAEGPGSVAFTYRKTDTGPNGLGLDFGAGLFPAYLAVRRVRLQIDAGFARTQFLGPGALILKAGMGSRLDLGLKPSLAPGLQAGAAAVIRLQRDCGIRVDLTRRVIFPGSGRVAQWSLGVGLTAMPARRPVPAP
jgi:hypothetical protein